MVAGHVVVDRERVAKVLGPPKFDDETMFRVKVPGVAIGPCSRNKPPLSRLGRPVWRAL